MVAALFALAPAHAHACENAVLATNEVIAGVKEAEKILNQGDPTQARSRIEALLGSADAFDERTPSAKGLTNRAMRIIHLANVRIDDRQGEFRKVLLTNAVEFLSIRERGSSAASSMGVMAVQEYSETCKNVLNAAHCFGLVTVRETRGVSVFAEAWDRKPSR